MKSKILKNNIKGNKPKCDPPRGRSNVTKRKHSEQFLKKQSRNKRIKLLAKKLKRKPTEDEVLLLDLLSNTFSQM